MNEDLQKQLIKQLKVINFWITFFGSLLIISMLIIGYLLFRVVTFVNKTNDNIQKLQQQTTEKLDLKTQVCEGNGSFSDIIKNRTSVCQ